MMYSCCDKKQQPFITFRVAGAQSKGKVEENCAGLDWKLTEDEMIRLNKEIKCYRQ